MEPIRHISGTAAPLNRSNIDTDQIIPAQWLKKIERTGFERGLFSQWRDDSNFVLNNEKFMAANILIAGENFGIGSSREHAVWALQQYGFKAIIASKFGDIFQNNSAKNGLLAVVLEETEVQELIALVTSQPNIEFTISIDTKKIEAPETGFISEFQLDSSTQKRLLDGLDDIAISMQFNDKISSFESDRPNWLPSN